MENTIKVTKRNVLDALVNYAKGGDLAYVKVNKDADNETITLTWEEVETFAENEIALLDKKSVKARERAQSKKDEADELTEIIRQNLTADLEPIADITARVAEVAPDATASKVAYRLNKLVSLGFACKDDMKLKDEEGKSRTVKAFAVLTGETGFSDDDAE